MKVCIENTPASYLLSFFASISPQSFLFLPYFALNSILILSTFPPFSLFVRVLFLFSKFSLKKATSKKRKSDATRLDEVDRSMYTTFCSAANSFPQLYSQAMNHQRLSFQAGEHHALEKLFQWILRQQEEGSRVTTTDIVSYLQNEVEFAAEESPISPRLSFQPQQHPQTATQLNTSSAPFSSTPISAAKNSVFSNALSSPVRRSLRLYHSVQVGYHSNNLLSSANGSRNTETNYCHQQIREVNSPSPNDCMDMHANSPARDFLL